TKGYGVGVVLAISPSDYQSKTAALSRLWTVQEGSGFQPRINLAGPPSVNETGWRPSEATKGQLRLRREGARLFYLINEEPGQPFQEISQADYGADSVDRVRLVANSGRSPAALDVRLLDVQMHWGGLPDHAATAPSGGVVNTGGAGGGTSADPHR